MYHNPSLKIEVNGIYTNAAGLIIKIIKRKIRPRSWTDKSFDHYFVDENGLRYQPNGFSLKGREGGLLPRVMRTITDRAQEVKVGETYEYHWPDKKSVGVYTVIEVDLKGYKIRWSNDAELYIQYGCPLNYDSVKIS